MLQIRVSVMEFGRFTGKHSGGKRQGRERLNGPILNYPPPRSTKQ
jgi:hypothetical protein